MLNRALLCASLALAAGCAAPSAGAPDSLLITNVRIVSPERETPSSATDVLIRGGRIAAIGPQEDAAGAEKIIDGTGRYLTPGLIDGHTHLSEIPGMTFEHEKTNPKIAREASRQIPRSYLYHGFTTVIDLNSRPDAIARWNARDVRPEAYFCGAAPVFDGYPMSWMPKPFRYDIMPYYLYDPSRADEFPKGVDPADHSPEAVAERMRADGAVCVKTHYEHGFGGRGDLPVPTVETVKALVAAAHEHGMPALLHANAQYAQEFGLGAGVDAFAHGMWTWNDRTAVDLTDETAAVLDEIIGRKIIVQPTIQVLYGERDIFDPDYLSRADVRAVLPQSLIGWYETEDGRWWRDRLAGVPYIRDLAEDGRWQEIDADPVARVMATLSYLAKNGGVLSFGSDTPSAPTYANPPGLNGRLEMRRWIDAGVSPAQLFRAATIVNAEFFGLEDEIGTVEEGKRGDLLLMTKNPMEDAGAYDAIDLVIARGHVHERPSLSAQAD